MRTSGAISNNKKLHGVVDEDREKSWKFVTDNGDIYFLSKQYCEIYTDNHGETWASIPLWLADKMGID